MNNKIISAKKAVEQALSDAKALIDLHGGVDVLKKAGEDKIAIKLLDLYSNLQAASIFLQD